MIKTEHIKKTAIVILLLTVVALFAAAQTFASSGNPKLSKSRLRIKAGGTAVLKVKGATKKVKWTVAGKKLVKVSAKGRKRLKAVIKAGKKTGTCYVKVKVGKKTLKCRVIVYKKAVQAPDDDFKEKSLSSDTEDMTSGFSTGKPAERKADDAFRSVFADTSVNMLKLVQESGDPGDNVLVSPDSILTAMAMAEAGASGDTLSEMESAFGGISRDAYAEYLSTLNSRLTDDKSIKYHIADSVWYRKGLMECRKEFLQKNVDFFRSQIFAAPFGDSTVSDMNSWVYNKTRGMIPSIINRLSPEDRLVLINAIAFEGTWAEPYMEGQIQPGAFTCADGSVTMDLNMLHGTEHTYVEICGAEGFIKPYAGGKIAFLGLEPPEGVSAEDFVRKLTGKDFIEGYNSRRTEKIVVNTVMPEFRYDYETELVGTMQKLGINDAFDPAAADFSELSDTSVYISDILHKTHIELDRNGTKAAAVTAIIAKNTSIVTEPPEVKEVHLDHPFVYAIIDTETGLPLFIGTVNTLK